MFNEKEDRQYLDEPNIYCLALEKYFNPTLYKSKKSNRTIAKAFVVSNEDHEKTFSLLSNTPKKKVLTVGSSGDQVLNAVLYGAEEVTLVDVNLYARYYTEYKIAAIKNLDFETFTHDFFNPEKMFSPQIFQNLFHDLSPDAQSFFGTIFQLDTPKHTYLRLFGDPLFELQGSAFIKNKNDFLKLKDKLKNAKIDYLEAEFNDFPKKAKEKYDLILLSNLADYIKQRHFKRVVNELYNNNLNDDGQIQAYYNLSVDYSWLDIEFIKNWFPKKITKTHYFKSMRWQEQTIQATSLISKPKTNDHSLSQEADELEK